MFSSKIVYVLVFVQLVGPADCRCPIKRSKCSSGDHDCSENATCTDVPEGFECACNPPFEGDGKTCTIPPAPQNICPVGEDCCESPPGGERCCTGVAEPGTVCTDDFGCTADNTACYSNRCRCFPGYRFSWSTGECVQSCSVYGETFSFYPFYKLDINSCTIIANNEFGSNCLARCRNSSTCNVAINDWALAVAVGYECGGETCTLADCNFGIYLPDPDSFTFIRDCA